MYIMFDGQLSFVYGDNNEPLVFFNILRSTIRTTNRTEELSCRATSNTSRTLESYPGNWNFWFD